MLLPYCNVSENWDEQVTKVDFININSIIIY